MNQTMFDPLRPIRYKNGVIHYHDESFTQEQLHRLAGSFPRYAAQFRNAGPDATQRGKPAPLTLGEVAFISVAHHLMTGYPSRNPGPRVIQHRAIAELGGCTVSSVEKIQRKLVAKGAIAVTTYPGKGVGYDFSELFRQCNAHALRED